MGGYFQFFTKNRPQNHQKRAILHTSQANGGARAPPGYATAHKGKQAKNTQNLNITKSIDVTIVIYHRLQSHLTL